ncbi:hypothetical protein ABPG72_017121 [Tetrahymena utriculariae]
MNNNLEKGQQSSQLEAMKKFYSLKISSQNANNIIYINKNKEQMNKQQNQNHNYQDTFNGLSLKNNKLDHRALVPTLISYQTLKNQIQDVKFNLDQNQIQISISQLDYILISGKDNILHENQILLYVEVLSNCNKQIDQYLRLAIFKQNNCDDQSLCLQLAQVLINKCLIWTQIYEYEPLMKVNTLINLGKLYRLQQKIVLSMETFVDALSLIMSKNLMAQCPEVYFYLAQINSQAGQHVKAIEYSKKTLDYCKKDIHSAEAAINILKGRGQLQLQQDHQNINSNSIQSANNLSIQKSSKQKNKEQGLQIKNQYNLKNQEHLFLSEESFYFWNEIKLINLIRCYEIQALEEEHFENFEDSFKLHQKAVAQVQEKLGIDHPASQKQLQKFINFQKRQAEFQLKKKQNLINQFKHLNIKPILQKDLKEKTQKYGQQLSKQFTQQKVNQHENIFSTRRNSLINILSKSPYNERIIPCQSLTSRTSRNFRNRSEESAKRKNVVVVRQKKLNLESLPCNLKVTQMNYTLPTQSSMFTSSTTAATSKNKNLQSRKHPFMSSFISRKLTENNISIFEGDSENLRNLLLSPCIDKRNSQEFQTIEESIQQQNEQAIKQQGSSTSLFNEGFSNYPPPRLRSGKSLSITARQKSPRIGLIKSEKIKNMIESKIASQTQYLAQPQLEIETTKNNNQLGSFLKNTLVSPRKNYLTKSYLQTFVEQIKTNWSSVNQQCQQINFLRRNQAPQRELQINQQKILNGDNYSNKKSPLYCDSAVPAMPTQGYFQNINNNIEDHNEIKSNQMKKNLIILPNQIIFSKNQIRQKKINYDQKELLYQQLQTKLKTQDQISSQNNNNDHCSTTITTSNHSNSIQYFPNQDKANEFQRKKSYSINNSKIKNMEATHQDALQNLQDKNTHELVFETSQINIKYIQSKDQIEINDFEEVEGQLKFFLNKASKMIIIEFVFNEQMAFQNTQEKQNLQYNKNNNDLRKANYHFLQIDNLFSLNQVITTNKQFILQQICEQLVSYLSIETKSNQLVLNNLNQNKINKLIKIVEIPQDDLSFFLINKDSQNSMILNQGQAKNFYNYKENKQRSASVALNRNNQNNNYLEISNKTKTNSIYENQNKQVVCSFFTKIYPKNQHKPNQQKQMIDDCFKQNQQMIQSPTNYQHQKQVLSPKIKQNPVKIKQNILQTEIFISENAKHNYDQQTESPQNIQSIQLLEKMQTPKSNATKKELNTGYFSDQYKIIQSNNQEKNQLSGQSRKNEDSDENKMTSSQKNLKFISYYQVPLFLDLSFNSSKNGQSEKEEQKNI